MDDLLNLLRKNALESPANLARMLATSEEDVKARIAEYEHTGVIRGYQAVINEERLDPDWVRAVIEVRITPEREGGFDRVANRIRDFEQVDSLYLMSGAYDLMVVVKGRNLREVAAFVSETLATVEGVVSTSTHFLLKTYKEQGIVMQMEKEHERLEVSP